MTLDPPSVYRFGDFELDTGAYELRRNGRAVRIERQPMDLLLLLVERRGQLVTRSDIIDRLWQKDVFVDVETGVHTAVRKIRRALRDSAEAPRFVETVSGKGYRFVAKVDLVSDRPMPGVAIEAQTTPGGAPPDESHVAMPVATAAASINEPPPFESSRQTRLAHADTRFTRTRLTLAAVAATLAIGFGGWAWRQYGATPASHPVTLAVLPFTNLSGDSEREYLVEGLTEETGAWLAQMDPEHLSVVARTSTLQYSGTTKSAADIGRELNADYLVEGSVRVEGDRLRVTTTLVRVRDQVRVWTELYDREPTSLLGVQRELSNAIAQQVRLRLSSRQIEVVAQRQTQSPDAYDLYLRGRNFENQRNPDANRRALEYYTRATAVDGTYALAWSAIARVLLGSLVNADASPGEVLPRARQAAEQAVRAGSASAETQFSLAYLQWCCDWDWTRSEAGLRQALQFDPRFAQGHLVLGHVLSQMGRHEEALQSALRARQLDPMSAIMPALSSQIAFQARDFRGAFDFARQATVLDPEFWIGHMMQGQALAQLGEYDAALESLTAAARFSGQNSKPLSLRAYILAKTGRADEARALASMLEQLSRTRYVPPYAMALISAGLDERDAVFLWLDRAFDARDMHLIYLTVDPKWDRFRDDPRFMALIARCGFAKPAPSR